MSILRYERRPLPAKLGSLPSEGKALLRLWLSIILLFPYVRTGAGTLDLFDDSGWGGYLAIFLFGVLPLASQAAVCGWVVRPMWLRYRYSQSAGAAAVLLLGLLYHLAFAIVLALLLHG